MQGVAAAIFDLIGSSVDYHRRVDKIDKIFSTMDTNRDGVISFVEFQQYCNTNTNIRNTIIYFP